VQEEPHPLESIAPNLPQEVIAAVDRGLQKNPDDRYRSAAEFAADLQLARLSLATSETSVLSGTIDGEKELSRESAGEPVLDPILRFPGTLEAPADITSRARSRRVYPLCQDS
jgi:serine/threonine protein kinase